MRNITLALLLLFSAWRGNCTIHTITTPGFSFSPASITIQEGDSVNFSIGGIHNVLEVSETTWNNNGNTPLSGGFSTPFGGGLLLPEDLTEGIHFYVCMPHASQGMKGMIIVEGTNSIGDTPSASALSFLPNPSTGIITFLINSPGDSKEYNLEIFDVQGNNVYKRENVNLGVNPEVNLSMLSKGLYFVQLRNNKETYVRKLILQ